MLIRGSQAKQNDTETSSFTACGRFCCCTDNYTALWGNEPICSRKKSHLQNSSGPCPAYCHLRNANPLGAVTFSRRCWDLMKQWKQPIQSHSILSSSHKAEIYQLEENLGRLFFVFIFHIRSVSVSHYCKTYFIAPVLLLPLKTCV